MNEIHGGEREREKARVRETESDGGERGLLLLRESDGEERGPLRLRESDGGDRGLLRLSGSNGEERGPLSLSESVEGVILLGPRNSSRNGRFSVESKTFEIEVEEKKGKMQATIVERKRGILSWIRMGPESLGLFF